MLELVFQADCPAEMIGGINEAVAMLLEQWGDVRLIQVRELQHEQLSLGGMKP